MQNQNQNYKIAYLHVFYSHDKCRNYEQFINIKNILKCILSTITDRRQPSAPESYSATEINVLMCFPVMLSKMHTKVYKYNNLLLLH